MGVLVAPVVEEAQAKAKAGKAFENKKWGYKLRVPKNWTPAAMSAEEAWICSKHIGDRELAPKKQDLYWQVRPDMWVIGFPHIRQQDRGAKRTEKDGVTEITINNPYKDYKDFLKREKWYVGGGYFFSKEEEATIGDQKVTMYEVKIEKMVMAPFRMLTWVYHYEDVDFAIQFKVLEDHFDDHEKAFETCLKSFKRIASESGVPAGVTTGPSITDVIEDEDLTPEEKEKRRKEQTERKIKREIDGLPKDWHHKRSEHYVVLSHADPKFSKKVLDFAEAIRGYLDETFPGIGSDYVPPGIIRIFANSAEETAFLQGTRSIWGRISEIPVTKKHGAGKDWEFEYLASRLTDQWLAFKNRELSSNMPYWISVGLSQHMKFARAKGKKVEFKPDEWDREQIKKLIKENTAIPLRDLLEGDSSKFTQYWHNLQAGSVVSWMLTKGNKGKMKNAARNYLAALLASLDEALEEFEAKQDELNKKRRKAMEGGPGDGTAEEEEEDEEGGYGSEEYWEEIREAMKERSDKIREEAFRSAFGHLTDKDWAKLDASWRKFAK